MTDSLLGRRALWNVAIRSDRPCAAGCRRCTFHCPMGARVLEHDVRPRLATVDDGDCSRCGECVDLCPAGVLHLAPRRPARRSGQA